MHEIIEKCRVAQKDESSGDSSSNYFVFCSQHKVLKEYITLPFEDHGYMCKNPIVHLSISTHVYFDNISHSKCIFFDSTVAF